MAKSRERPTWAWDTEAENWDETNAAVAVSTAGDVERFYGPDAMARMSDHMDRVGGAFVGHAAGIYDTPLLMNVREKPFAELVMSGSAILTAKDGALKVRDSFRWWLASLKDVGVYVDKLDGGTGRFLKRDVDRTAIDLLTPEETLAYCEADTRTLLEGVVRCRQWLTDQGSRHAWTSGASALNLLATLEPLGWRMMNGLALTEHEAEQARECVRGARVEVWAHGRIDGSVYAYDFKSAYPAAYMTRDLGVGVRPAKAAERGPGVIWLARWFWARRDRLPPVLDQDTNAGAGWCQAWVCPDELDDLEAAGVRVELVRGWAAETMAPIGQTFVRRLYDLKEAGAFWAKVFLNSLHGKFSENPIRECWRGDKKPETWYGPDPELVGSYWHFFQAAGAHGEEVPRHIQPIAAALILGRQRSRLYRGLRAVQTYGGRIFYADTDSILCDLPPERMAQIGAMSGAFRLGKSMGDLAPEGGPFTGFFLGPKAYCLCDPSTGEPKKGALKGVPWKQLKQGVREASAGASSAPVYRPARGGEPSRDLRLDLFETVLRRGHVLAQKEGITTFVSGLRRGEKWGRLLTTRTISATARNKVFRQTDGESSTVWAYKTPGEVAAKRWYIEGDAAPDAPETPEQQLDLEDPWGDSF